MKKETLLEELCAHPGKFDAFLIDLDGTIRLGGTLLPGAVEFINYLREHNIPFRYLTNSSAMTYDNMAARLTEIGLPAAPEEFISSVEPAAEYFKMHNTSGKAWKFFLIGETLKPFIPGVITYETDPAKIMECDGVQINGGPGDWRINLTAVLNFFMRFPDRPFLIPNPDILNPLPDGVSICPSGQAQLIINLLEYAGIWKEFINLGKPHSAIYQAALKSLNMQPSPKIVGVGDLLSSDIDGANRAGLSSALVLSGLTTLEKIEQSSIKPHYIFTSLA